AFVGDVQGIGVGRIRRAAIGLATYFYAVLFGIGQQALARVEVPFTPRSDDLHVRHQGIGGQLETHLVIALAGGAMGNGIGAGLAGDLDHALGDQRARDRGAEQVFALIHGVGAKHWIYVIAHKLLAQIIDEDFLHAKRLGLGAHVIQFLALAHIRGEGYDFAL